MAQRILDRSHLFSSLQASFLPPVITIIAPSGYGKTTFAEQLQAYLDIPAIWQRATVWQRDSIALTDSSVRAWQTKLPDIVLDDIGDSPENHALALVDAVRADSSHPILYIIDDAHHLYGSREAERWLQTWVTHAPPFVYTVVVGQKLPTLHWRHAVRDVPMLSFTKTDLKWTADELYKHGGVRAERANYLVAKYGGVAAALRLALNPSLDDHIAVETRVDAQFAALANAYFAKQMPDEQHMLLTVATLESVTPIQASALWKMPEVIPYLARLQQEHIFVSRKDDSYVLHALFRDVLQQQLKHIQPSHFQQLHIQAAQWYEDHDLHEQAVTHYLLADAGEQAITVGERVVRDYQVRGQWHALLQMNHLLRANLPRVCECWQLLYCVT